MPYFNLWLIKPMLKLDKDEKLHFIEHYGGNYLSIHNLG